ncbi:MAG TPA: hypothetical protein VMF70_00620 [Gemmatimonadales bacterium]|nr:hypothetical protein [Gemmatimonadales bacterium]
MRRRDFEAMVRGMIRELPPEFREGIVEVEVTPKRVPHPVRAGIYTMGECVPHVFGAPGDEGAQLRSTVYLHHGSFAALAAGDASFDWRHEAWETLTHEVRHHLEWRANEAALEAFDDAVEANYARQEGEPFDPLFFRDGERVAPGVTKVEDDVFVDRPLGRRAWRRAAGTSLEFGWHGRTYRVALPERVPDVLFVTVDGVEPEPAGELVVVVRRRPGWRDLFRRPEVRRVELQGTVGG